MSGYDLHHPRVGPQTRSSDLQLLPVSKVKDRLTSSTKGRYLARSLRRDRWPLNQDLEGSCRAGVARGVPSTSNDLAHRIQILRIDHAAFMGEFPPVVL